MITYLFFYALGYVIAILSMFVIALIWKLRIYSEDYKKRD